MIAHLFQIDVCSSEKKIITNVCASSWGSYKDADKDQDQCS